MTEYQPIFSPPVVAHHSPVFSRGFSGLARMIFIVCAFDHLAFVQLLNMGVGLLSVHEQSETASFGFVFGLISLG